MTLSKSEYMMFLKHPAWLWLKKHDKSKLPEVDPALQAMFDNGHLFEEYAEQLFPNNIKLGFNKYSEYLTLPQRTSEALKNGAKTIFQGRFESGNITCIIDVLDKVDDGKFDLFEIKSSTSVKPEHIYDLAFQVVVLENTGLKIRNIKVIHVNNQYIRNGGINIKALTSTTDVTEKVRSMIDKTKIYIQQALRTIGSNEPPGMSPRFVRMGPLDEWLAIYKSIFKDIDPHSIYNLSSLEAPLIGELEDLGISLIKDIPDNINLNRKQKLQVQTTKTDTRIIDKNKISEFLQKIKYPIY